MPDYFKGARILAFETRRQRELGVLVHKLGGHFISAPALQEVELERQTAAFDFAEKLALGQVDGLVLLTGVGARWLLRASVERLGESEALTRLADVRIYCRGPKPVAVLKEHQLRPTVVAPEPNTWRELLAALTPEPLSGLRLYVQEYGVPAPELRAALEARGAQVSVVPVYAYELPDDTGPLQRAIAQLATSEVDAVLFTAVQQVRHVQQIAEQLGLWAEVQRAIKSGATLIASVGPSTTEALEQAGLRVDCSPPHPKMGQLVTHLARHYETLRAARDRGL